MTGGVAGASAGGDLPRRRAPVRLVTGLQTAHTSQEVRVAKLCELFVSDVECRQARGLLQEWSWLLEGRSFRTVALTIFGDWFLEDRRDGTVWFLDAGFGGLKQVAASREAWRRALVPGSPGRQTWLLEGQHDLLTRRGDARPGPGRCWGWKLCPRAGGSLEIDNLSVGPIDLHQVFHARFTRRLSHLPEGASIPQEWIEEVLQEVLGVLDQREPGGPGENEPAQATGLRVPLVSVGLVVGLVLVGVVALS